MIQRFSPLGEVATISMDEQDLQATYARVIYRQLALGPTIPRIVWARLSVV